MNEAPRKLETGVDGLSQLKSLLFRGEADRLHAVEARVDVLDGRVGDAPRLEEATAQILVEALRRAEVARHRELAGAIAPVVVASIRNEIKNSREMMVEALYPLTGQLVVAAVSNAFREMIATMNERLDRLTSVDRWKLQLRARMTGRPVSELAMAQQMRPRLLRVLFLERQSGALLASWRADGQAENRGEMVGGLIAALTGFARDALGESEKGGDIRTLDFAGRDIYVHASPAHLIATEVDRQLRSEERVSLDRDCLAWLAQYARVGEADDKIFGDFIERALEKTRQPKKKPLGWPIKIAAGVLALLVIGFATRAAVREWRERELQAAMARVFSERPALAAYPLGLTTDHYAGLVALRGLAPSREDIDALKAGLGAAAGNYRVEDNVGIVATEASLAAERLRVDAIASRLAGEFDARAQDLGGKIEDLGKNAAKEEALSTTREALAAARDDHARLADVAREAATKLGAVDAGVGDLRARAETPRAKMAALTDGFAVFFERDQIIDRAGLNERLKSIAGLLNETELGLRVVGYSDDSGSERINQTISRRRADVVAEMLASLGAPKNRMTAVGRAATNLIADATPGARERNRRVVFEIAYDGEIAP
jgi:outer membrane protein OmpA-like peptidoglycan-associated protein